MCFCWFLRLCFDLPGAESIQQSFAQGNDDFLCPILNRAFLDLSIRMNKIWTRHKNKTSEGFKWVNPCNECESTESTLNLVRHWHVLTSKAWTICEQQFRTWLQAITTVRVFQRMVFLWWFQAPQKTSRTYVQYVPTVFVSLFDLVCSSIAAAGREQWRFWCSIWVPLHHLVCIKAWVRRKWCRYTRMIQLNPNPRGMRDAYRLFINIGQVPVRRTGHNAGKDF